MEDKRKGDINKFYEYVNNATLPSTLRLVIASIQDYAEDASAENLIALEGALVIALQKVQFVKNSKTNDSLSPEKLKEVTSSIKFVMSLFENIRNPKNN